MGQKSKLVYLIITLKLATKLPLIGGTAAQATTAPRDNCHFKLGSNGIKTKLFSSGSTTQLATKLALIRKTNAQVTKAPGDN